MRRFVINLERRPDKLATFRETCPWSDVEVYPAVDCNVCPPPRWWYAGGGAWGCYRSHINVIEQCLLEGVDEVTILEDDAVPCDDFDAKYEAYMRALPDDWGMAYLGGQLLKSKTHPPENVAEDGIVWIPFNVNRTHAYMLRGEGMRRVYQHMCDTQGWNRTHHVDHHLGVYHEKRPGGVYVPAVWLFRQRGGKSDVNGQQKPDEFWPDPASAGGYVTAAVVRGDALHPRVEALIGQLGRVDQHVLEERLRRFVNEEVSRGRTVSLPDHPFIRKIFPKISAI